MCQHDAGVDVARSPALCGMNSPYVAGWVAAAQTARDNHGRPQRDAEPPRHGEWLVRDQSLGVLLSLGHTLE